MDGTTSELSQSYKCRYCEKEFRKESTLTAHLCEAKRRHQQQNETGVQLGLRAYLRFYEVTQGSAKLKSYDDFASSPYYNAFVKFGRHLVGIRCVSPAHFIDWLLKNNKKLDHWCKDEFYSEWLSDYLKKENYRDALERGIKEMRDYAEDRPELKNGFVDYFRCGNTNRICYHIVTGRISPWVVYNCDSGVEFLDNLNEEQVILIMPWIDTDFWQRKFTEYMADQLDTREILKVAGL
jgi:hypothetical protein